MNLFPIEWGYSGDDGLITGIGFRFPRKDRSLAEIPMKFIKIVEDEVKRLGLHSVLTDCFYTDELLRNQYVLSWIRGLLFVHKTFGIIQNPLETCPVFIKNILSYACELDCAMYALIEEGGSSIINHIKIYEYSFQENAQPLDVFQVYFAEQIREWFENLISDDFGNTSKSKFTSELKEWSAFMQNRRHQVNISNLDENQKNRLENQRRLKEKKEVEKNGIAGAVCVYAKNHEDMEIKLKEYIRAKTNYHAQLFKSPRGIKLDGRFFLSGPHNKITPVLRDCYKTGKTDPG